ncbi:MAG: Gfo/Idh/MocA family oxidoreductase [Bacteroidetes bacterium]|nr:Gfo/Idh/MocA family oxidoreductase [Bacteroidota bacterium]
MSQQHRRKFLRQAALTSAAAAFPSIFIQAAARSVHRSSFRKPGEMVRLACIGIGNQAAWDLRQFEKTGLARFVAFCDTDMGAPHTQPVLKDYPDVPRFQDFRKMFDRMAGEIDAVLVGTPDHSHFPATMMALGLGKHVYVEKPMARTFQEVELMMKAARQHPKLVTQMGNQGHSEGNYFQFKAWKQAGIIQDVTAITAHMNSARRWHGWKTDITGFPSGEPVPSTLDWDTWHGVVQEHAYHHDFINGQWRCWFDFGMGALGDWGAHLIDTAHQFLELGLPTEVSMLKAEGHNRFFYPQSSTILFRFPKRGNMPACDITWYDGINNLPPLPEGYASSATTADSAIPPPGGVNAKPVRLQPGKIIYGKDLTFKGGSHGSTLSIIPASKGQDLASRLPEIPTSPSNHHTNFLRACMGEEQTRSPFEVAGPLSQVFCLGVIAQFTNASLQFDPVKKRITNHKEADRLLKGVPPRKGWEQYYKV